MRLTTFLCCCAVVACAPSNTPDTAPTPAETVRVAGAAGAMAVEIHPANDAIGGLVPGTMDGTWAAVRSAFDSLSLPVAAFDVATHTIATPTMRLRRRLGETALSKYLDCGNTQGGRSADSYEVQMLVQTTLRQGDAGSTRVETTVFAEGRPITLSGDYTRCSSTGNLERRVVALVNNQLRR